jgi:hypothetical protein
MASLASARPRLHIGRPLTKDRMDRILDPELDAAADEELALAVCLAWRDLAALTPWGDSYEGFGPAGGAVVFERSYLWNGEEGGDILCEVTAFRGPARYERGVRKARVIRRPADATAG